MQVTFNKHVVTISEVLRVIQDAGFAAELLQKQDIEAPQEVLLDFQLTQGICFHVQRHMQGAQEHTWTSA